MRFHLCLSVGLTLLMGGGQARSDSGDISGGVFIAHAPPSLQYTNSPPSGSWCTEYSENQAITTCEDQDNRIDSQGMAVWYVLCAWAESKTWCGIEFGLGDYDEEAFVILEHGPCFPSEGLTIPTSGWPGPSEGIALTTTDAAWSGNFAPIYWFAGYAYAEDLIPLSPDPASGFGGWARCEDQGEFEADDFGGMGLLTDGIYVCPEGEFDGGGDMAEEGATEGNLAGDGDVGLDYPDSVSSSVCCLDDQCVFVSESECEELGGFFIHSMESCEGDPCGFEDDRTVREIYPDTPGGIRQAIFISDDNDTILLHDGVYSGSNNRDLRLDFPAGGHPRDLVIMSVSNDPSCCTIDCSDPFAAHWGIWVVGTPESTGHTIIKGITIKGSVADNQEPCPRCENGAGIFIGQNDPVGQADSVEVINCVFEDCEALAVGGGIFCNGGSWFSAWDCTFQSNVAKDGGAIFSSSRLNPGYCEITDCYFDGNSADGGGAISSLSPEIGSDLDLWIYSCVFRDNASTFDGTEGAHGGGAVFLVGQSAAIDHSTFYENAGYWGGGIYVTNNSEVELTNSIVTASAGEAFRCYGADPPAVSCCDFYGNSGGDWVGCVEGMGMGTNISEPPLLCDPGDGDFRLQEGSPCLPDPGGDCVTGMGANPITCPPSWSPEPAQDEHVAGLALSPNPSDGRVKLTFRASNSEQLPAVVEVMDVTGRVIRSILGGQSGASASDLTWDGLDEEGHPVPEGVYVLRLRTGHLVQQARAVVIR